MYSDRQCQNVAEGSRDGMNFSLAPTADYLGVCPLNPNALRARINAAITRHDYVALSGLFLWESTDKKWIDDRMFELRGLSRLRPIAMQFDVEETEVNDLATPTTINLPDLTRAPSDEELLALKPTRESEVVHIAKELNELALLNEIERGELLTPNSKRQPSRLFIQAQDEKKPDAAITQTAFALLHRNGCWWASFVDSEPLNGLKSND